MEAKGYKIIGKFFLILFALNSSSFIYCMKRSAKEKESHYEQLADPLIQGARSFLQKFNIDLDNESALQDIIGGLQDKAKRYGAIEQNSIDQAVDQFKNLFQGQDISPDAEGFFKGMLRNVQTRARDYANVDESAVDQLATRAKGFLQRFNVNLDNEDSVKRSFRSVGSKIREYMTSDEDGVGQVVEQIKGLLPNANIGGRTEGFLKEVIRRAQQQARNYGELNEDHINQAADGVINLLQGININSEQENLLKGVIRGIHAKVREYGESDEQGVNSLFDAVRDLLPEINISSNQENLLKDAIRNIQAKFREYGNADEGKIEDLIEQAKNLLRGLNIEGLDDENVLKNILKLAQDKGREYFYEDDSEVGQVVKESKKVLKDLNMKDLLVKVRRDIEADKARQYQEKVDQIKSQNTILFGTANWPFAFYKSDIVSGACFASRLGIEVIFYKQLKQARIDNIFDMITTNSKELLDLLHKVKNDKQGFEKEYNKKGFFSRMFTRKQKQFTKLEKELRDYVAQNHTLIHKNPFLPKLLWAYALEFFGQKVCSAVESSLLTKDPLVKESYFAYEKQADGQLKQSKEFAPFSIVTLLKFFIAPRLALYDESSQFDFKFQKMINTFCGLGIPSCYFSKFTTVALQILSLGLAAKFFDSYYTSIWTEYLVKNQKELLQILERYNHTKFGDGKENLAFIELELRNFIMQGHKKSSWLPGSFVRQWFAQKNVADSWTAFMFGVPVTSLLLYKGYQFYKNLN